MTHEEFAAVFARIGGTVNANEVRVKLFMTTADGEYLEKTVTIQPRQLVMALMAFGDGEPVFMADVAKPRCKTEAAEWPTDIVIKMKAIP